MGFAFGDSSRALFAKAGGVIAGVSAGLTSKVELGIPQDNPRNPAVIADNVGDVAGMGVDLFDSNVAAIASALVIAKSLGAGFANVSMAYCYTILGLLSSIIGIATARIGKNSNPTYALNSTTYVTTDVFLALSAMPLLAEPISSTVSILWSLPCSSVSSSVLLYLQCSPPC